MCPLPRSSRQARSFSSLPLPCLFALPFAWSSACLPCLLPYRVLLCFAYCLWDSLQTCKKSGLIFCHQGSGESGCQTLHSFATQQQGEHCASLQHLTASPVQCIICSHHNNRCFIPSPLSCDVYAENNQIVRERKGNVTLCRHYGRRGGGGEGRGSGA